MRPLYLRGVEPLTVSLDGPALRVAQRAAADRRFPLARVSRVVVSSRVSWTTDALLACADEGITVCFLARNGAARARWTGRASKRSEFAQRWHDFVDRPDWRELYAQWRASARRRSIRFCALRMGWSPKQDLRQLVRTITDSARHAVGNRELGAINKRLQGLSRARAVAELSNAGLGANDDALSRIVPELAVAIQWGLYPNLSRWISRRTRDDSPARRKTLANTPTMARFFERHKRAGDFHLRDTLRFLNRYITTHQ